MHSPQSFTRQPRLARLAAVAIAAVIATAAAPAASADDRVDRARAHYQRGLELFNQSQYKAAIAEFAAADGLAPSPILEFNMALCYDRLGDDEEALRRYKLYLKRVPDATNRAEVEAKIARLEERAGAGGGKPDHEALPDKGESDDASDPAAGAEPPAATPPAAGTGDRDLDRVAAVDVGAIRDARGGGPPPPPAAGERAAPPAPERGGNDDRPKPLYKKWWFWVIVAVGTLIIIDFATSDNDSNDDTVPAQALDPGLDQRFEAMSRGGFTLRF
jgi:hypothetical protein